MSAYFLQADLEARLSAQVVREIMDDDNSGSADSAPLDMLIADASSKVDSYLLNTYKKHMPFDDPPPSEVKRLALDIGVALASQRHPEVVRRDWQKLMEYAEKELVALRDGGTRLVLPIDEGGGTAPDAGSINTGEDPRAGVIASAGPLQVFLGGMGDF